MQPTEFEMRHRNTKFANDVRAGKHATHLSRQDKLARRSPLNIWALGLVVFVVIGGGMCTLPTLLNLPLSNASGIQFYSSWPGSYFYKILHAVTSDFNLMLGIGMYTATLGLTLQKHFV